MSITKSDLIENLKMCFEIIEMGMEIEELIFTEESNMDLLKLAYDRQYKVEELYVRMERQFPCEFNFVKEKYETR